MFESEHTGPIMAAALEIPAGDIAPDLALGTCPAWTSLSHLRLILSLEDLLGRRLRPDEIVGLMSVSQVDQLLSAGV